MMKKKEEALLDAFGGIDPELILGADPALPQKRRISTKWSIAVACLLVLLLAIPAGILIAKHAKEDTLPPDPVKDDSGRLLWVDERERNEKSYYSQNSAIVWRWEYQELYEQYSTVLYNGREYGIRYNASNTASPLTSAYLGEKLGSARAQGYDIYEEKQHTLDCTVYEIQKLDSAEFIAVYLEGSDRLYVAKCRDYIPPATLGDMLERYQAAEYISLPSFYYEKDNKEEAHHSLSAEAADAIWQLIAKHADTPIEEDYTYYRNREHVSFALRSVPLGIENLSMTVNSEGYLQTNLADYGYSFAIGTEAAMEIIEYAKAHKGGTPAPTRGYLVGTVTEIGEGYFKLDDSIMMKNPEEGIIFTVNAEALRIRRYFEMGVLKVGSTVFVTYDGKIYADDPTKIENPLSLDECFISENGENILIPE